MFTFDPRSGRISAPDTPFKNGRLAFRLREFVCSSDSMEWKASGRVAVAVKGGCQFSVGIKGPALRVEVKNAGGQDVFFEDATLSFSPADMGGGLEAGEHLEFIHSFSFEKLSGVKKVGLPTRWLDPNPESSMIYVVRHMVTQESYLFSILPPLQGDFVTFRALHAEAHMEGRFGVLIRSEQRRLLRKGRKAALTPIRLEKGKDPLALLNSAGDDLAEAIRRPLKSVRTGWNSWDYFAGAVTSRDIFENQKTAKSLFGGQVNLFVIDEGWEPRWGAWVANWKFPEGTKGFCQKIKSQGGAPGVWTAPLLVNTYTDIFRAHPDWFGRGKDGQIVQKLYSYGPMAYLDITHPEVEAFVFDTFRRLRSDGFEYFKVDFTQCVLECDRFRDATVPRGLILRKAFETIRKAIGESAYLLACGAPYESVLGVVDAVRTTGDIHNFWAHVLANAASMAARWWTHRKLWNVDPDFLIVRTPETTDDKQLNRTLSVKPFSYRDYWVAGRELNINEARAYALLVYLSAGDVILGDDLAKLNAQGVDILRKVLDRRLEDAAVPLDMFDHHGGLPALWMAEEEDWHFLGVFNWEEEYLEFHVDLKELGIGDCRDIELLWSGKKLQPESGLMTVRLAPRSCEGLRIWKK
ncbi:MAG TPA: alpha-galactosidase [Candidatus Brocadiia bacterium]|nr:alpha-galactosidase [Candidatus Brocadiia bacterium]